MKCVKLITLIPNYFEEDIDSKVKVEMDNHIATCQNCRKKFEERKEVFDTFKYMLVDEEIQIKSRKDEIINNIDKSRYTSTIVNKTFYRLYVKKGAFIGVVVAVFLMFIALKHGGNIYNTAIHYGTKITEKNKVIEQTAEKVVPTVNPELPSTVKINFKELSNPTGEVISTTVNSAYRKKLVEMLNKMKQLSPGVGPWRIIYCNDGKLMFYNYNHMIACNYTEKEKSIYSILDFSNLKVGSYQGSEVLVFNFSPDGNYLLLGTSTFELNVKSDKSLYIYDLNNDRIIEIASNFSMREENVKWYNNVNSSSSKWVVSTKDDKSTVIWDVANAKALEKLPIDVKETPYKNKFLNSEDLEFTDDKGTITELVTESYIERFWFKDSNTLIGVQSIEGIENLKLMDFQVVEINISDKTGKVTFRP
jgi:WD40 repeat protein